MSQFDEMITYQRDMDLQAKYDQEAEDWYQAQLERWEKRAMALRGLAPSSPPERREPKRAPFKYFYKGKEVKSFFNL